MTWGMAILKIQCAKMVQAKDTADLSLIASKVVNFVASSMRVRTNLFSP